MLEIKGLTKIFNTNTGKLIVLDNISCKFNTSRIVGIVGPNGAGKTTLFKCLVGLLEPTAGKIFVNNKEITQFQDLRGSVRVLFEGERSFYWNLTGRDNLRYFCALRNGTKKNIDELIELFQLNPFIDRMAGSYSRGMKQKLALSISCLGNPKILLLDEPTHGLDAESLSKLKKIIREVSQYYKLLVVIASHDYKFLSTVTDNLFTLMDNKLGIKEGYFTSDVEILFSDVIAEEDALLLTHEMNNSRTKLKSEINNEAVFREVARLISLGYSIETIEQNYNVNKSGSWYGNSN